MAKINKTLLNSSMYISDIHSLLELFAPIKLKRDITILVTGATGLICSSVIDVLEALNIQQNMDWKIYIAARNIQKAKSRFSEYEKYKNISFLEYDLSQQITIPKGIDYIIHGAGNAYPSLYAQEPVETLTTCINGLEQILHYSVENKTRVLYISSSEVYGLLHNSAPIKENEYGYIDILNPRSSYSMGKRAAETLCASYISEFDTNCVIVRPGHIFGPTASKKDNRVSSTFMYAAVQGMDLILKSSGEQLRSYCYCLDCASAIVFALFTGKNGEAYNISNKDSLCTIKEMAEHFAKAGNVCLKFDLPSEKEKKAFNPMLNSTLDSTKLEELGWKACFSKEEGFEHSIIIMKETEE